MTKKDFEKAAKLIAAKRKSLALPKLATKLEEVFVEFFEGDNPRFDRERFLTACRKVD